MRNSRPFRIILASESPRRREILSELFESLEVIPSGIPEQVEVGLSPAALSVQLAFEKASVVARRHPGSFVIGADTLVILDGEILRKPVDRKDAEFMLRKLSARTQQVITGVAVIHQKERWELCVTTDVSFSPLSDDEIHWYTNTTEPYDKAGGYGIQGHGARFIQKIHGDYLNVVGFPLAAFYREMVRRGIDPAVFRNQV